MGRGLVLILVLLFGASSCLGAEESWLGWFSASLRKTERELNAVRAELGSLAAPVVGQTAVELGYMHTRLAAAPPASPWVQVDLQAPQPIDWIALIPAQVDWQPLGGASYGFPQRFRIDVSDDPEFATFSPVAVYTDADYPQPGIAPVAVRAEGRVGRYVRITVTKLAVENGQHFFALGELMVIAGRRNLAIGRPVAASAAINLPPRWAPANLVDGRTSLGPPVERELLPYDGLYAGDSAVPSSQFLWMSVDLGRSFPLQEVRIHPVHARLGADIPGYAFPARFRVEAANDAEFSQPMRLFDTGESDYSNPGNNAVTIRAEVVTARYVRFTAIEPSRAMKRHRFGLSEIEIFSGDTNVARQGRVDSTADPSTYSGTWPRAQLVDGFTSYGRLIDLPQWLAGWQRRTGLQARLDALANDEREFTTVARSRATWTGGSLAAILVTAVALFGVHQRRRRSHELVQFRTRLARDLHDEIGSNLAGLAVLSESLADQASVPTAARDDWREVNRIAHETTDAMREVLWVIGAREEAGHELTVQLHNAAARMLTGRTVHWTTCSAPAAESWSADTRRHVFLFFKEVLANVVRHSAATEVTLSAATQPGYFELSVADNGRGFALATAPRGMGLASLRDRARLLKGVFTLSSAPGAGTRVDLRIPVAPEKPRPPLASA